MQDNEFNKLKTKAERKAKEAQEAAKAKQEEEALKAAKEKREKYGKAIQKEREAFIQTLGEKDNAAQKLIENFSKEKTSGKSSVSNNDTGTEKTISGH